ncbi:MAG: CbiQ family ECF transporter T component [Desulfuromonadales bacterium]|nr:CbiQ family ECF transporter T component [Desulfuromonadales bacterium]
MSAPGRASLAVIDIRLKLPACLGLTIMAFAAPGWRPLLIVLVATAVAVLLSSISPMRLLKGVWSLRWLLLFTLLLHLLLSPGYTLFGSRWLSLDGLLRGLFVCGQIVTAFAAALLLSLSSRPQELATAFGWYLQPLRRLNCPVDAWREQLGLVLHFVPLVRAEFAARPKADPGRVRSLRAPFWQRLQTDLGALVDRLVALADAQAERLLAGELAAGGPDDLSALRPLQGGNGLTLCAALLVLAGYLLAGLC